MRNVKTSNAVLDSELSLMSDEELGYLGKYLRMVRGIGKKFDDGYSWADFPLTDEEEAQLEEARRNFADRKYLTLAEFMESGEE